MRYDHTQRGVLHLIFVALGFAHVIAAAVVASTVVDDDGRAIALILALVGLLLAALAGLFARLRVHDDGDALRIAFGPCELFRRRVRYASIRSVRPIRTSWLHGVGIHSAPGGGWTWNLRGKDAVEVMLERSRLVVGTDDPEGLATFLRAKSATR
ncbi:MAG: hypothetical protein EXS13_13495 [Planctomycetes bacterium]|nr:hypothetical protein [Planctomycetota bacterium]